jgi:hypothetical protein
MGDNGEESLRPVPTVSTLFESIIQRHGRNRKRKRSSTQAKRPATKTHRARILQNTMISYYCNTVGAPVSDISGYVGYIPLSILSRSVRHAAVETVIGGPIACH